MSLDDGDEGAGDTRAGDTGAGDAGAGDAGASDTVAGQELGPVPRLALAIYAHPDDPDVSCGGTLAKWAAAGSEVHVCLCCDGGKGSLARGPTRANWCGSGTGRSKHPAGC